MTNRYVTETEKAGLKKRMDNYLGRLEKAGIKRRQLLVSDAELAVIKLIVSAWRGDSTGLNYQQSAAASSLRPAEAARVEFAKAELRLEAVPRIEAEIVKVRVTAHAGQARLEAAARELSASGEAVKEARAAARKSSDEVAELRGQRFAAKAKPVVVKKPAKAG